MTAVTESEIMAVADPVARLRCPPWSELAEQSVLGALLLDNRAWDAVGDALQPADFYSGRHRPIFEAIGAMANACKPVDVLTLSDRLQAAGKLDQCGGLAYLAALSQCVVSAVNVRRHAELVREKSLLRAMIATADEAAAQAFREDRPASDLLADVSAKLDALQSGRVDDDPISADVLAVQWIDALNDRATGNAPLAWATGLRDLDDALNGGLQPGRVYVIAARPSVGKSAFAMQVGLHRAQAGDGVLLLSQEMDGQECMGRMVSNLGGVDHGGIQRAHLSDRDWTSVSTAVEAIAQMPLWVYARGALTLRQIRAKAMGKRKQGLKLLIVDYLQLCSGLAPGGRQNRNSELEEISRGIKALAMQMGIAVLLLAQLNRDVEKRQMPKPMLSDLRDSGAIEQDADVVAFLWPVRELGGRKILGLTLGKNRQGKNGIDIPLEFHGWHQRFLDSEADISPQSMRAAKTPEFE